MLQEAILIPHEIWLFLEDLLHQIQFWVWAGWFRLKHHMRGHPRMVQKWQEHPLDHHAHLGGCVLHGLSVFLLTIITHKRGGGRAYHTHHLPSFQFSFNTGKAKMLGFYIETMLGPHLLRV